MRLLRYKGQRPEVLSLGQGAGAIIQVKYGPRIADSLHLGPNEVNWVITHDDGTYELSGPSYNLITNGGKDYVSAALGGALGFGVSGTIATASSATTLTGTATPFVASAYIGQIVIAEESTNQPVHGTVVSNTTSVLTVDAWRNGDDSAGTTPGATANFAILAGQAPVRYMALTTDSGAAAAADTTLATEITTAGAGRALATYAHTAGTATFTLVKAYTITGTLTAIHKMGLFFHSTASTGPMVFETTLNADATVVNGDTLTVTETVTLS